MSYESLSQIVPGIKFDAQQIYELENSGVSKEEIEKRLKRWSHLQDLPGGFQSIDASIKDLLSKGRANIKSKGIPASPAPNEKFNFDPDAQDELEAAGVDNRVLGDKRLELLNKYGPSGDKRYYDFVIEQRKKGREALDKQKAEASKPPAPSTPTPPTSNTSASAPPQASLPSAPPQATTSALNLAQSRSAMLSPNYPMPSIHYQDAMKKRYASIYGAERGKKEFENWLAQKRSQAEATKNPSPREGWDDPYEQKAKATVGATNQPNRKELFPDVGDQIDPETGRRIPAEVVTKLTAQEIARRLANKPYVENPHNKTAELNDLEKAGYGVLHDLVERGRNPEGIGFFNPPRGGGGRALDDFYNQDFKYDKAITLKEKLMENVRKNALKRLNQSYEDLGRQMSARKIGRSGYEEVLKTRMRENMDDELNLIDSKMAMDLLAQQHQLAGQGVQHVQNQDAIEYKKAHDAYVLNKAEEASRKEEQRKNAMNAIDRGQGLRAYDQEALNRRAAEFERKNTHHDRQADTYLGRLKESQIGTPNLYLPDRTQSHGPTFMHNIQPGEPSRIPIPNAQPLLTQVQPDTSLKDTVGAITAGTGLILKNKEIDKMK